MSEPLQGLELATDDRKHVHIDASLRALPMEVLVEYAQPLVHEALTNILKSANAAAAAQGLVLTPNITVRLEFSLVLETLPASEAV